MLQQVSSLNQLRTFAIAAQTLSFKQTAQVLNITPTAVSHQIKALEAELRVQLFVRHTRAISLTNEGQTLANSCTSAFRQLEQSVTALQTQADHVTLSCCNSFAALWLTPRSGELAQRLPACQLKTLASDALVNLQHDQHIDLALRYGQDQGNDDEVHLGQERIALYAPAQGLTAIGRKPKLFVTHWPDESWLKNLAWQQHVNADEFDVQTCEQEYFVLQAVMTGQGFGLLSNVLSSTALAQGWIVADSRVEPFAGYSYWLRSNVNRADKLEVRQVQNWLVQQLGGSLKG